MKINPFKAVFPNFDLITSPESFFGSVKYSYNEFLDNGFFDQSRNEALYVYRIVNRDRDFLGVVGKIDLELFETATVKKHENTLAPKEQKQLQLIMRRQAMVKPILLTHTASNSLHSALYDISNARKPNFEIKFEDEHVMHQFWAVETKEEIDQLVSLVENEIDTTYIADGHHRSAAQNLLRKRDDGSTQYDQIVCTLFADDQLDIFEYNRMVHMPFNMSHNAFIAHLSTFCEVNLIEKGRRPTSKNNLTMFLDNEWFDLKWKESTIKLFEKQETILDVDILNSVILKQIFKIDDIRDDSRVKYIDGKTSLDRLEEKTMKHDNYVSFVLYPVDLRDIMHKADIGEVMPPKSTWFEPRMKNGLIIHDFKQS